MQPADTIIVMRSFDLGMVIVAVALLAATTGGAVVAAVNALRGHRAVILAAVRAGQDIGAEEVFTDARKAFQGAFKGNRGNRYGVASGADTARLLDVTRPEPVKGRVEVKMPA